MARESAAELDKEKSATAAIAHAMLARLLVVQRNNKEAHNEISLARTITRSVQDLTLLIPVQIASALVQADFGWPARAIQLLKPLIRDCAKRQFIDSGFEARLALGEIQMRSASKEGVVTLQRLEHDAKALGYSRVMNKAGEARRRQESP